MTQVVLPKVDKDLDEDAKGKVMGIVDKTGCLLISDGWSSTDHWPIINALAATPLGAYFLTALDTSGATKDADYIAALIISQIVTFGPEHVTAVCMDGACKSSFEAIEAKFPHVFCFICPTHSIDNFLQNINEDKDEVRIKVKLARARAPACE